MSFMGPKHPLQCSQQPTTGPYTTPYEPSPHTVIYSQFSLTSLPPSMPHSPGGLFPSDFQTKL
jgi:hypothetical protein